MIRLAKKQLGQGMTEYIVMVALIAIAGIGVYVAFNWGLREQTTAIMLEVAGGDGSEMNKNSQYSADVAAYLGRKQKALDSYVYER